MALVQIHSTKTTDEFTLVEGESVGDFAVHQPLPDDEWRYGRWMVAHRPTGLATAYRFPDKTSALKAAADIQKLRDSWSTLTVDEATVELRDLVHAVAQRYGGVSEGGCQGPVVARFNSYAVPS